MFSDFFFSPENRAVYEIMPKNMVDPENADIVAPSRIILDN
jgi:hypothetical protein